MSQLIKYLLFVILFYAAEAALNFEIEYQWQFINFTWPSRASYRNAINSRSYIPQNVATIGSVKYYDDKIFLSIPQLHEGIPATLGYISTKTSPKSNPLITPYPSWQMNIKENCKTLQSVLSTEIDDKGIMWVIDGVRSNQYTKCPAKLVLLDLKRNGRIVFARDFPDDICSRNGGFLNDIVLDKTENGVFAYMTESSSTDPGLIVFSQKDNRVWKLRDKSMFAEIGQAGFVVNNLAFNQYNPINGIALSPKISNTRDRVIYFSSLTGVKLHSLPAKSARNYSAYDTGDWRRDVKFIGKKQSQGDGMIMDNKGDLYYGLIPLYSVGKWSQNTPFSEAHVVAHDNDMVWIDAFGFDNKGNLLMITNNCNRFLDPNYQLRVTDEILFRIFKAKTGTKSYMYS